MQGPAGISFSQPLDRAWQRARLILFSPFDLGKWMVLGFSGWLANLAGGGGGGWSWRGNLDLDHGPDLRGMEQSFEGAMDWLGRNAVWLPLIGLAVLVVVGLLLAFLWLSSRGKFIFLDNVVHDRAEIVGPWKRYRAAGNSLFWWRLGFALVVLAAVAVLAGAIIGLAVLGKNHAGWTLLIVPGGLVMLGLILAAVYVDLYLESFVIPIMYRFELSATEAWRVFLQWWNRHVWHFLLYGLFVLGLWILFGLAVTLVGLFTCCIAFFFLMLPYIGTVLTLPWWVTYRALSVEFLGQFDPSFDLFAAALEEDGEGPAGGGPVDATELAPPPQVPPPAPPFGGGM